MKAKDLMVPLQEYLAPEMTLKKAAEILRTARRNEQSCGVKGLPVLDKTGDMIGFLSIGDILKAVFPPYMALMDLGEFTWDGMVEGLAKKYREKKVAELMTKKVITVPEEAALMACVDHMLKNNVKRLPVINKEGKVTGILYERDVFYAISRAMIENNAGGGQ
jgi:predicted transcriptional regulator